MIRLKSAKEIDRLAVSGKKLAEILRKVAAEVRPGVTTADLDTFASELIKKSGGRATFLHYRPEGASRPYPASLCVSINEEVVHGIPSDREILAGDLVTVDCGLCYDNLYTDMAITVALDPVSKRVKELLTATEEALNAGIAAALPGGAIGDIGSAVEAVAKKHKLGLVEELSGHGVGFAVHEDPFVPNYGRHGHGEKLVPGLVIAIEPMFSLGGGMVRCLDDGYTFVTQDGSRSAHFEKTIAITDDGVRILTE